MLHVHLIHGTWPYGPFRLKSRFGQRQDHKQWFEKGSAFREALARRGTGDLTLRHFAWSGANTHTARAIAASSFSRYLQNEITADPKSFHAVIAHSHGGNVALQALNLLPKDARQSVIGLATMATPFLTFHGVSGGRLQRAIRLYPTVFLPALIAILVAVALVDRTLSLARVSLLCIGLSALLTGGWILLLAINIRAVDRRLRYLRLWSTNAYLPSLLVIRATGDEATVWLAGAQFFAHVNDLTWRWLYGIIFRPIDRFHPAITLTVYLIGFVPILLPLFGGAAFDGIDVRAQMLAAPTISLALCFLVGGLFFLPTAVIQSIAVGPQMFLLLFVNDVRVEATPSNWEGPIANIGITPAEGRAIGLNHSIHELESVRTRISEWLSSLVSLERSESS